jgi:phosphatidylserine/phosphatidylglycerophosphate/cardiolipin synthase-like enzyme
MISRFLQRLKRSPSDLLTSQLHNEQTFYRAFKRDLTACTHEAVIESPYITSNRVASLLPIFEKMRSRNVSIVVNTRHPAEHESPYVIQAQRAVKQLQEIGVKVLYTGKLHRKIAVFDQTIVWEGSLNILSQNDSCEIMRRVESEVISQQMLRFLKLGQF